MLYSLDTLAEYAEKLLDRGISPSEVTAFIRLLALHGEIVPVVFFHFRHYPVDSDNVMFLLCAMNGPRIWSPTTDISSRSCPTMPGRSRSASRLNF
jgi:hypothetical protein